MSFEMESNRIAPNNASSNDGVTRRFVNFQPSAWGDYFLSYDSNTMEEDNTVRKHLQELKERVRNMFAAAEKSSEKLRLIDSIQRLGLSYHFEEEINEILEHIQKSCNVDDDEDVNIMALRFRLLRQQGYFVSCEIFSKLTNERGEFKESIVKDEGGLLSLYEASHLRMNGENILDEAFAFTTTHLRAIVMDYSSSPFAEEVKYALKWPIYKAFPRFTTKHYISLYEKDPFNNNDLLTFAKLDYNILQKLYQKELGELSRWWKDLKLMEQLSFARDRAVECYVWALTVYYEPKYSRARILLAKMITFISVLDDMYDVYATWNELELFTRTLERWDTNDIDELPNYMKVVYKAIFEVYRQAEEDICLENNIPFTLDHAKEMMKGLCRVYFMEATWFHKGYVPTIEEYMKVALISSSYYVFVSTILLGMGVASKEVIEWAKNEPVLLKATGVIGRIMNDITSHKFEQERGHVASAVECYMKQYGVSEEDALVELDKQVVKAWKDVTEDYIKSTKIPNVILMRVLNISRGSYLFYREEDGYTIVDGATKNFITSLVLESVPI